MTTRKSKIEVLFLCSVALILHVHNPFTSVSATDTYRFYSV